MSRAGIEGLVNAARSNQDLVSQIKAATSNQELAALASRHGFDVSAAEWQALRDMKEPPGPGELSEGDLSQVSGGVTEFLYWMGKAMYQNVASWWRS
jgi:predicted ribosomally synthesized peptide with nif11-like leader